MMLYWINMFIDRIFVRSELPYIHAGSSTQVAELSVSYDSSARKLRSYSLQFLIHLSKLCASLVARKFRFNIVTNL